MSNHEPSIAGLPKGVALLHEPSLNKGTAFARGLTAIPEPTDLPGHIKSQMYDPTYQEYV